MSGDFHPSLLAATTLHLLKGEGLNYKAVSDRVDAALSLIDPERLSSATGIVNLFERDAQGVRSDRRLSQEGQDERIREIAPRRLENLASVAKRVTDLEAEYRTEEGAVLTKVIPEPTTNDTLVDIALAGHALNLLQRSATDPNALARFSGLARNGSERMRVALARMPVELSGLTEDQRMQARHSLVPQTVAERLNAEGRALAAARKTVQGCIGYLTSKAQIERRALVGMFGDGWKV